ncbi:MAG: HlyC/CorC family transporter [Candidatus Aminicenantes bacterium]|nr:HlyC/CorC family transporter [Candidatus Aminicenantes bacterium]
MLTQVGLFLLFLALSAFFSSSETAFLSINPYTLEYLEKKGSKRAHLIRKTLTRLNDLLATILIGNTLVNVAAASIATSIFVRLYPDPNRAVLLATLVTTLLILIFGEINPKIIAAHRPIKVSSFFIYPIRFFSILLYPFTRLFSLLPSLFLPPEERSGNIFAHHLSEEEIKVVISSGAKGLSKLRKKMLAGVLDLSTRPVKEIMIPRTQVRALKIDSSLDEVIKVVQECGFSRYPVYRETIDNIEGLFHAKDILPFLRSDQEFDLRAWLRKPLFVPELASIEKVLLQMQEKAVHLAFVVDEFGSFEGIVSLEDILEEIVGDIRDEYDRKAEDWYQKISDNEFIIKGSSSIKEINEILNLGIPEKKDYTTLAGLFLYHYGHLPTERASVKIKNMQFTVEKMNKRHLSLIRVKILTPESPKESS